MSPKTLTGEELVLDDGPARDAELFLVDGNNLAYRAFFALPEELQTTDGQPTNALLGFTNMLFKLLSDYKPRGVAVAWDTRPVHRKEIDAEYKADRRPMPDLLREQFPHFRPIVEAFGYQNLEFEGWEADDVIATLATQADEAGVKTCVVSTDRDAFQLVLRERLPDDDAARRRRRAGLHARAGRGPLRHPARPDPGLHRPQGGHERQHPRHPGHRRQDGRPARSRSTARSRTSSSTPASCRRRARRRSPRTPSRRRRRSSSRRCGATSTSASTPRRSSCSRRTARELKEIFRRFEFRGLLGRVDTLDEALPAAERPQTRDRDGSAGAKATSPALRGRVGVAADAERVAVATEAGEVIVGARADAARCRTAPICEVVAHDAKALRLGEPAADDTMIAAYLIDPGRAEYELDDLMAEYGVELEPDPPAEEETAALVRHAEAARRLAGPLAAKVAERGSERLYREIELPLTVVLAAMEDAGVRIDTYRMGEITARLSDRIEELESRAYDLAGEEFVLGSPQQLGRILFEKLELTPGRKGKTGYSTDAKVLRAIRGDHEIVPVIEEWRELTKLVNTYLGPLPTLIGEDGRLHTTINQTVAATGRLSTTSPNLQAIPIRTELGREIRSAFVAEPGTRLLSADYSQIELRILAHVSGEPKLREAFARGEDIHTATAAEVLGKDPATLTKDERNVAKMINFGIVYGISAFGLSENLDIPKEQAQAYIDAYLARFPHVQAFIARTIAQAARGRLRDEPARPPPPGARASRDEPADARLRRARRRQLRHAGLERRHHQGRDGRDPRAAARGGTSRAARPPGARRAPARGSGDRGRRRCASSCARRWSARTRSIRRSPSTSASATTGRRRSRNGSDC